MSEIGLIEHKYAVHISGTITELLRTSLDDVAMAIRLYGQAEDLGISVEVSFVERKKI